MAKSKRAKKAVKSGKPAVKQSRKEKVRAGKDDNARKKQGVASTGTGTRDHSNALPEPQINVVDLQVLRALIEEHGRQQLVEVQRLLQHDREQRAAHATVPIPASPYDDDNALGRLLATTSEIRERGARAEVDLGEIRRRLSLLEENQRPPEPTPDRDSLVRVASFRLVLARQCRAENMVRPTPAIVGRAMHDERVFGRSAAKSPQQIFSAIYTTVRRVFRLQSSPPESSGPEIDHVHLTEDMVQLMEGRSLRPKKKHAAYYDSELKPRLKLLIKSGYVEVDENQHGERTDYSRYLTPDGREVFNGWPEWTDVTGGISLAEGRLQTDAPPSVTNSASPPDRPAPSGPTETTPPAT
jgi:hypothetical protein